MRLVPVAALGVDFEFGCFLGHLKNAIHLSKRFHIVTAFEISTITSTSVAVSESPLSLPSGRSCNSPEMHSGSSTELRDVDFCDGMLRRERTLIPDCDLGIWGELPPSEDPSMSANDLRDLVCASFNFLKQIEGEH